MNPSSQDNNHQPQKFQVTPSFLELLHKYGLVIIMRDEQTNEPTWLACKFCPSYGCDHRRKDYLMVYDMPFDDKKAEKHLKREHPKIWKRYSKCQSFEEKSAFFTNMVLPPICKFLDRVAELQKSNWHIGKRKAIHLAPNPYVQPNEPTTATVQDTGKGNNNAKNNDQPEQPQMKKARLTNNEQADTPKKGNKCPDSPEFYKFEPELTESWLFNPHYFDLNGCVMAKVYGDVLQEDPDLLAGRRLLQKQTQNTDSEMTVNDNIVNASA